MMHLELGTTRDLVEIEPVADELGNLWRVYEGGAWTSHCGCGVEVTGTLSDTKALMGYHTRTSNEVAA